MDSPYATVFENVEAPEKSADAPAALAEAWQKEHPLPDYHDYASVFDKAENPERQFAGLEVARAKARKNPDEDVADFLTNRSVPVASAVLNFGLKKTYAESMKRFQAGDAYGDDLDVIAGYDEMQKREAAKGVGASIGSGLAHIPAILGEGAMAGGFVRGGAATAFRLGGRAAAVTAGEAAAGVTLRGTAAAAPAWLGRTAAQTVLMPSMYLPQSADNAIKNGGEWSDLKNLGPAYAIGTAQVGLLGGLSQAPGAVAKAFPTTIAGRAMTGNTLGAWATRLMAGTGTGMTGQEAIDTGAHIAGWKTEWGTMTELVNGKEGALKHAAVQAAVFAVFSTLHAHHDPNAARTQQGTDVLAASGRYLDLMKMRGYSESAAGKEMQQVHQAIMDQIQGKDIEGAYNSFSKMGKQYADTLAREMDVPRLAEEQAKVEQQASQKPPTPPQTAPQVAPDAISAPPEAPASPEADLAANAKPVPGDQGPESFAQRLAKGENQADIFRDFHDQGGKPEGWTAIEGRAAELNPEYGAPTAPMPQTVPGSRKVGATPRQAAPARAEGERYYRVPNSKAEGSNVEAALKELRGSTFANLFASRGAEANAPYHKAGKVQFEFAGEHFRGQEQGDFVEHTGKTEATLGGTAPMYMHRALTAIRYRGSAESPEFATLQEKIRAYNEARASKGLEPIKLEATSSTSARPSAATTSGESTPEKAPVVDQSVRPAEPAPEAPVPRGTPEAPPKAEPRPMTEEEFKAAHPEVLTPEDATAAVKVARRAFNDAGKSGLNTAPFAAKLKAAIDARNEVASRIRQKVGGDQTLPPEMEASINATKLTEQEKAAVVARVTDSDGLRPLAEKMGVSHETVRKRALDGLAKLKESDPELWQDVKKRLEDLQTNALRQRAERQAGDPDHVPDEEDPVVQTDLEKAPRVSKLSPEELTQEAAETQEYLDDLARQPDQTRPEPPRVRPGDQPGLRGEAAPPQPAVAAEGTEGAAAQGNAEPATAAPAAGGAAPRRVLTPKERLAANSKDVKPVMDEAKAILSPNAIIDVHELAADKISQDDAMNGPERRMVADAKKLLQVHAPDWSRVMNKGGDHAGVKGFDEVANQIFGNREHRGFFQGMDPDLAESSAASKTTVGEILWNSLERSRDGRLVDASKVRGKAYSEAINDVIQREIENAATKATQSGLAAAAVENLVRSGEKAGQTEFAASEARVAATSSAEAAEPAPGEESPGDEGTAGRTGEFDFGANAGRPVRGVGPERPEPSDAVMEAATEFAKQESGHVVPEAILSRAYDLAARIGNTIKFVQNNWREFAGNQFPRTARFSEDVAQKMVEWVHAKTAAIYGTPHYIDLVMGSLKAPAKTQAGRLLDALRGQQVPQAARRMAGAVETEWRLEFMHDAYQNRSVDLLAQARKTKAGPEYARLTALAQEARQDAANVGTIIGAKNSPLQTDAQYRAALNSPGHKAIQAKWEQHMVPEMEANFKKAMGLDPQDAIDSFTQRPGHPINLKNIGPNDPITSSAIQSIPRGPSRGNLGNVRQGRLGFSRQAKGTGTYDIDLGAIIANSLGKGLSAAGRAEALKSMIKADVAHPGEPFKTKEGYTEFKNTFPEAGNALAEKGETSLYVKNESAGEYRQALQVDEAPKYPLIAGFNQVLTRANLASSVDAVYHGKNMLTFLFKPGVRLPDLLRNAYDVIRNTPEGQARLFELAKLGRMKSPGSEAGLLLGERFKSVDPTYHMHRALDSVSKIIRLTASDAFDRMSGDRADVIAEAVKSITGKYPFEKGELNKTNFINQLGQYNKRSQNSLLVLLRDTGISPFATAGTNYYVQSMRGLTGASGARTTGLGGEVASRGEYFAKVGAVLGTVAAINYLAWKRSDGDDDVPLGSIKVGNKNGKSQYLDLTSLTGLTRGARQTGMLAIAEGERAGGKKATEAAEEDKAFNNIVDSLLHPFVGPGAASIHTAITGRNLAGYDIRQPASAGFDSTTGASQPKEGDARRNLAAAAWQANPALEVFRPEIQKKLGMAVSPKDKTAQQPVEDRAMKLLGPFGIKTKLGGRRR